MNRCEAIILAIALAIMAVALPGCGATDDDGFEYEPVELGKAEQAMSVYIDNKYGSDRGQNRCTTPDWQGDQCNIPYDKTLNLYFATPHAPFEPGDWDDLCGPWWADRIEAAIQLWELYMNKQSPFSGSGVGNGWDLEYKGRHNPGQGPPGGFVAPYHVMRCDQDYTTPGSGFLLGVTTTNAPILGTCIGQGIECADTPYGVLVKFGISWTDINAAEFNSLSGFAQLTANQKSTFVDNVVRHELGHVVGLGHTSWDGLMRAGGPLNSTTQEYWPSGLEKALLRHYNPYGTSPM